MKKLNFLVGGISLLIVTAVLALIPAGCDFTRPQKTFRLAVPDTDFYTYMASHLKPFLESKGYKIDIVHAESTLDAVQMVADAKAELTLINNHSITVALMLADKADRLRTVMPITTRVLFGFTKAPMSDSTTAQVFQNKRVGIELLGGETHLTLMRFFSTAKITGFKFVTFEDNPDIVMFWDTFYGARVADRLEKGWYPRSFKQNWVDFVCLNDHTLRPFTVPAVPGNSKSIVTNTMATDVILVANEDLGENAGYLLANAIFQNKVDLIHRDIMYNTINEQFNKETLLFPLHQGTFSYLLRDQPTFFERYAESLALAITILAVFYSAAQAIQTRLRRNQKERIDKYFLEFLEIRQDREMPLTDRVNKLDELFHRAVLQMTNEKLDKGDFHILSRLIQQDLTMLSFK